MTDNEKTTTFGATIEAHQPAPQIITPSKTAASSLRDGPPSPTSLAPSEPGNPFYEQHTDEKSTTHVHTTDLEAQRENPLGLVSTENSYPTSSTVAATASTKTRCKDDDSMWPSPHAQKAKAKMLKQQKCAKSWNPMKRLGRRQKIVVTIVIALFIIGAAVGIGVGISKAVGGGVTKVGGGTRPIGDHGNKRR